MLGGDLRIGLREGLVEAAIAKAFDRPLDDVKWAGMLVGDVGRLAGLARDDALDSASLALFHPLKFMLASPAEDAAEIVGRLGPAVWVEDKYDGIRAQLHKSGTDVRLYSRDLHDVSGGYPEIVDRRRVAAWDGILDGEILGWRDGTVLPFIALQARLGRKAPSAAIQAEVPVIFVAFDVLALRARRRRAGRAAARAAADRAARPRSTRWTCRWRRTAAGSRGRTWSRPRDADALEAAFVDARGPAQRGADGQGPGQRLLARAGAASAG